MKRLADLYWPESADRDPMVVAERRLLSVFLVLAGLGLMAVATVYFQKNTQAYPLHAGGVFLAALASLLTPIWTSRAPNTKRVAAFILLTALAINTILGSWIDGLISVKAILFLPISVAAVLIFGSFAGLLVGLYSALVFVGWHVFRDRIGGNLAIPMSVDDLSLMLLIGLSLALTMLLAASANLSGPVACHSRGLGCSKEGSGACQSRQEPAAGECKSRTANAHEWDH